MTYDPQLSHFDLDLKRGAQGELFVKNIIKMLADGSATIEVKTDYRFTTTGRWYIEQECRGRDGKWRPSGINTTKATFWAFVFGESPGLLFIETEWLRRAVDLAAQHDKNKVSCDYGENPTRGTLVYFNHFLKTHSNYDVMADAEGCFNDAYAAVRSRMANGGPGWKPK